MSVKQFIERMAVKRDVSPATYSNEFSIKSYRIEQRNKATQENLSVENRYLRILDRHRKKLQRQQSYYARNRDDVCRKARAHYYANHQEAKERKRVTSKEWRRKNHQRAYQVSKAWRERNPEKVKQFNKAKYVRRKESMSPDEYKVWQRERNKQAKAKKIAEIGIEAYRAQERARIQKHYANNPDALKRNRERNKERMRLKREIEKENQA